MMDENNLLTGDLPGDKILINDSHILRVEKIMPYVLEEINASNSSKIVISVYGGSGVGKSEIASLIARRLTSQRIATYVLSGDNYPYRIPEQNNQERLNCFRYAGIVALAKESTFETEWMNIVRKAWENQDDTKSEQRNNHPLWEDYQQAGLAALMNYLGSSAEIDFSLINNIIHLFKQNAERIPLKRMGRESGDITFESVLFREIQVLIIEWTHGNNSALQGIDFPIFLFSTPEETLQHRILRARDKGVDSPFTKLVLQIEQNLLASQAENAALIVAKNGESLTYDEFRKRSQ